MTPREALIVWFKNSEKNADNFLGWLWHAGFRVVPLGDEPDEAEVEAAAQWLMSDDSAYAADPEFAKRAARHMTAAARRALEILTRPKASTEEGE